MFRSRKGQSALEYAVIVSVVIGALLAMQIYMKRGLENRMRQSGDSVGKQFAAGTTTVERITNRSSFITETTLTGTTNTITANDISEMSANEYVHEFGTGLNELE